MIETNYNKYTIRRERRNVDLMWKILSCSSVLEMCGLIISQKITIRKTKNLLLLSVDQFDRMVKILLFLELTFSVSMDINPTHYINDNSFAILTHSFY